MARSRREKVLIIGVAAAVSVFALDRYVFEPFRTAREGIAKDHDVAQTQLDDAERLIRRERRMRRDWAQMTAAGIESGAWDAERQMLRSMQTWVQQAGIANASLRPERTAAEHGFTRVTVHVTGTGPSAAMAKLLWSIESASVPVRVETLQLTPAAQKEGTDELRLTLAASRLCTMPEGEAKPGIPGNVGGGSVGARQPLASAPREVRP
jgi:hypothetical protein